MNDILREKIKQIVKKDASDWDWNVHVQIVVKNALLLAKKLGADESIVEIAAWLHDITQLRGDEENHHISGPIEAEKILKELGYPQEKIDRIKHCINAHRGSQSIKRETIEAECVASADAMAHFDTIMPLIYLNITKYRRNIEETKDWMRKKLERSWNKLIPEAKEMVKDKYEAAKIILE